MNARFTSWTSSSNLLLPHPNQPFDSFPARGQVQRRCDLRRLEQ
jgi:hypothetical protein